jgi:hypothetical protein
MDIIVWTERPLKANITSLHDLLEIYAVVVAGPHRHACKSGRTKLQQITLKLQTLKLTRVHITYFCIFYTCHKYTYLSFQFRTYLDGPSAYMQLFFSKFLNSKLHCEKNTLTFRYGTHHSTCASSYWPAYCVQ